MNTLKHLIGITLLIFFSACSMDVMPIHESRIKSAHLAERPLERGQNAAGAFHFVYSFDKSDGYSFDPGRIEFIQGVARMKKNLRLRSVVETSQGVKFSAIDQLKEIPGAAHKGKLLYQFSINTTAWFYHDGKKWTLAGPSSQQANPIEEVNQHISKFHTEVGNGSLYVRILFVAPTGSEPVELKQLELFGVNTHRDGWD